MYCVLIVALSNIIEKIDKLIVNSNGTESVESNISYLPSKYTMYGHAKTSFLTMESHMARTNLP